MEKVKRVPKKHGLTVLLVDDNPAIRRELSKLYLSDGFAISGEAGNGREAIDLTKKIAPDLIVLDLSMPVLNGLDATPQLRKLAPKAAIVLLTITRLIEFVDERTLVLLDEPEGHLHPPLLSAFIRSLVDLLIKRNGVAIIATHSPVVLQEVPQGCVWKLHRSGGISEAERPTIETFGENVGVLTREVFGLEVTNAGFHKLLKDAIEIEGLTKRFGHLTAVNDLSLKVAKGEVLGFLGPNGAGKSTTMKMVTGFLTPTADRVRVCGHDVENDEIAAQSCIGYLPEGAPAYGDMTARQFLNFIAQVRGFRSARAKERIDSVVARTELSDVLDQRIETLSKGFKRRVGLAQAILHDPPDGPFFAP